jgi:hypothetical protein
MKNRIYLIVLYVILLSSFIKTTAQEVAVEKVKFEPSGKAFGQVFANVHDSFSNDRSLAAFEITRSYLGYDYSFSRTLMGRIIYDATVGTLNGKTIYQGYLRNVYLQFDNGLFNIKGGIITTEQLAINVKMWNYLFMGRLFADYIGMSFTSDLGMSVKYNLSKKISFDLSVTNGLGYKNIAPDSSFRYSAGMTFLPTNNFIIRGYFDIKNRNKVVQSTLDVSGAYVTDKVIMGAEYVLQKNHLNSDNNDYSGFSVFARLRLKEKLFIFGKYDDLSSGTPDGFTDAWNLAKDGSNLYIGLEYAPVKGVRLAPNFGIIIPDDHNSVKTTIVGLNTELKF